MPGTYLEVGEEEIQRPVLIPPDRRHVCHLLLHFPPDARPTEGRLGISSPVRFLRQVLQEPGGLASVAQARRDRSCRKRPLLMNVGFTFRGLRRLGVPPHVMTCLALRSPAFGAGAPARAGTCTGDTGASDPAHWNGAFRLDHLHAVIMLHADDAGEIERRSARIREFADERCPSASVVPLPLGQVLRDGEGVKLHFGVRDGVSRVGVRKWQEPIDEDETKLKRISLHEIGEFVLGFADDQKTNPWIRDMSGEVLPPEVRRFFLHGTFGVLRQISQDTIKFAKFVRGEVKRLKALVPIADEQVLHDYVVSRLVGRWPNGDRSTETSPYEPTVPALKDFDYEDDRKGIACPFGGHVRRMNPRGTPIAQPFPRPLMRRGMSYGPECDGIPDGIDRGLLGLFFCASIEEQFEHLLGQWADRVPLGSPDQGDAKDPIVGNNRPDACFFAPQPEGRPPIVMSGLSPFVTTRGMAYLFYPSLSTVRGIAGSDLWIAQEDIPR